MMQKLWQKKLELKYSNDVLDIVQFGSSISKENFNDIDIAVIFKKSSDREQIKQAYGIKKQLQKMVEKEIHISSYDLNSFFNLSNFAREGILFYGISLISQKPFAYNFGLTPRVQIKYVLKNLEKKDKVSFHYMLKGKGGKYGLIREFGGELISPGLIEINPEFENIFMKAIDKFISSYEVSRIFVSSGKFGG